MTLSVLALLLVGVTMGLSLAHALEFPGKLRLDEQTYRAVQTIYYPGFSIGGLIGELGGLLLLALAVLLASPMSSGFWWKIAALALMIGCHATYWLVTHPVNRAWLEDVRLGLASRSFFDAFSADDADWRDMRNIWEWSHVARAGLSMLSFLSLSIAIAL